MRASDFEALCREACAHLPPVRPDELAAGATISVHDIEFNVMRFETDPEAAYLLCDVGAPAEEFRGEIFQSLLEMHRLSIGLPNPGVFAYESDLERIVFQVRLQLAPEAGGVVLARLMNDLAHQVQAWRNDFLNGRLLRDIADSPPPHRPWPGA